MKNQMGRHQQAGFTLLEVMVTVVILSIGLLGLAGLQATALSFNSTAYQRTQATNLANYIIDAMRANAAAARVGAGNYLIDLTTATPTATPTTLAAADVQSWRRAVANVLPSGTSSLVGTCANTGLPSPPTSAASCINSPIIVTIVIQWNQWDDETRAYTLQGFSTMTQI